MHHALHKCQWNPLCELSFARSQIVADNENSMNKNSIDAIVEQSLPLLIGLKWNGEILISVLRVLIGVAK